jgi:hypothetical protein
MTGCAPRAVLNAETVNLISYDSNILLKLFKTPRPDLDLTS